MEVGEVITKKMIGPRGYIVFDLFIGCYQYLGRYLFNGKVIIQDHGPDNDAMDLPLGCDPACACCVVGVSSRRKQCEKERRDGDEAP